MFCRRTGNDGWCVIHIRYSFFLMLTALLMLAMPVRADGGDANPVRPENLMAIGAGTIKEILKSDMIMLDDGTRYSLDNILVPMKDAPVTDELKHEFLNKKVTVYTYHDSNGNLDRYGVPLVHVVTDKGVWVQQELISKGLVWAYPSTQSNTQPATQSDAQSSQVTSQQIMGVLKQIEEKARKQRKGFWADPAYAVKTPDTVKDFENSYQIVEGKILSVYVKPHSGTVFFNFGDDWKKDFSVRVALRKVSLLGLVPDPDLHGKSPKIIFDENSDPLHWKDRIVRVRGWVLGGSSPVIDLTDKEQIDFIPQSRK